MDNKLLNKAITINGKEERLQGGKPVMKLKDERNLTYTVYKTKQDGTTSVAWDQLQELSVGDTVQIGYVEDQGEYQGKEVTYRTIRSFNKDIGEGIKNYQSHNPAPSAKEARIGQNLASSDAPDWDFIFYRDKQIDIACATLQKGEPFSNVQKALEDGTFGLMCRAAIDVAKGRTAKGWAKAEAIFKEELPTIEQEEVPTEAFSNDPMSVENIDF